MCIQYFRLICCALFALSLSPTVNAAVIHWELDSSSGAYTDGYVKGGFDFNTANNQINNITAEVFTNGYGCIQCMLYDDATVTYYPGIQPIVEFSKTFYTNNVLDREGYFSISASNIDDVISPFDLSSPGTYVGLSYRERGYLRLDNPMDPSIFSQDDCPQCAVAVGTLIAIPEPESCALLLVGLGMIGWRLKSMQKTATNPLITSS